MGREWRRSLICGRERCGSQTKHGKVGRSWSRWVSQLPPLIKPDGRISRTRLSENLRRKAIGVASASVRSSPAGLCYDGKKAPPSDAPTPKAAAQPRVPAEANLPTLTRRFQTWRASPARLAYQSQRLATLYLFACSGGVSLGNGGVDGGCRLGGKSPGDSEKREE